MTTSTKVSYILIDATNTPVFEGDKGMLEVLASDLANCKVVPKVTVTTIAE